MEIMLDKLGLCETCAIVWPDYEPNTAYYYGPKWPVCKDHYTEED
jgi:hypothetical protein